MAPKLHLTLIIAGLAAMAPSAWAQSESLPADPSAAAGQEPAQAESIVESVAESMADESSQTRQDITYVRDANKQAKHEQAQLAERLAALQARLESLEAELEATRESSGEAADPE